MDGGGSCCRDISRITNKELRQQKDVKLTPLISRIHCVVADELAKSLKGPMCNIQQYLVIRKHIVSNVSQKQMQLRHGAFKMISEIYL